MFMRYFKQQILKTNADHKSSSNLQNLIKKANTQNLMKYMLY